MICTNSDKHDHLSEFEINIILPLNICSIYKYTIVREKDYMGIKYF